MRISDWSSDVCSSDLRPAEPGGGGVDEPLPHPELAQIILDESGYTAMLQADRSAESAGRLENLTDLVRAMEEHETIGAFLEHVSLVMDNAVAAARSKETRGGKECASCGNTRGEPDT